MKSAPSIAFDVRPSRIVLAGAVAIVALAVGAPWFAGLPTSARLLLSLVGGTVGVIAVARYAAARFARIAYGARGWTLVDPDGVESPADLIAHARFGSIVALDFRAAGRRRFRTLLDASNCDAEMRRRLILLLARAEVVQTG